MKKFNWFKKATASFLILTLLLMLCSCSVSVEVPYDNEEMFSTRNPLIAEAFEMVDYDMEIHMTKVVEKISFFHLYEYTITFAIYERINKVYDKDNRLTSYDLGTHTHYVIDEIFFTDKAPYDVLDYHQSSTLITTAELSPMLQDVFDELSRTAVLIAIRDGNLEIKEKSDAQILAQLKYDATESLKEIAKEYAPDLEAKDIVSEAINIFRKFPMGSNLGSMIQKVIVQTFELGDYIESKNDVDLAKLMERKIWDILFGFHALEENAFAPYMTTDIDAHKKLLAARSDAFAEKIITKSNK